MEKIIFWGLIIPILLFVVYLGGRAIMTGFSAKSSNRSSTELQSNDKLENFRELGNEIGQILKIKSNNTYKR